jgi:integrating conjugative element protein (TIGR03749 family)
MKKIYCLILAMSLAITAYAESRERIIWDKKPITVSLSVGQERTIHFPAEIRYWLPDSLKPALTVISASGVLYVKAKHPFDKTRIRVQEIESSHVYLLDLQGMEGGSYPDELIVLKLNDIQSEAEGVSVQAPQQDWYARLIRVAAQNMYAPERLIESDPDIHRIKLKSSEPVNLIRGGDIEAMPLAAWQGGGYYVTAIRLCNTGKSVRVIDPRMDIRGQWLAATLQHPFMSGAGTEEDRTSMYLISEKRFEEALQ